MGMAAILVMLPGLFIYTLVPPTCMCLIVLPIKFDFDRSSGFRDDL